ncbi:AGC/DMPK protein kinase [Vavraia culicis subsp. floridensis]|uniref:non-specific serine/threonine protein kinase n=1 Tax=Vavraia culicis (isolate floridensis) TaxID=948595 RepID=L2GSM6_VAVCU|nr:AGC/DMPK protein kinase [Vavraia culicis subsp. floridensis]ELA46095.1 AGC/DMPK protein kinase [Vavraia culicis subsp. floridensis]
MTRDERENSKIDLNYLLDCAELVSYGTRIPNEIAQLCRSRLSLHNFLLVRGIAKGGYGSVYLVQSHQSQRYYALKVIKKQVVIDMPHLALFENEKAALKSARDAQYLVFMHCSFQNEHSIFFLMDFYPCELLERVPVRDEHELRFYATGILLAIEELHKLGYVHRDIKPENIFLDRNGCVKLADFGSCCRIKDADERINEGTVMRSMRSRKLTGSSARSSGSTCSANRSEIMVGTPDYIAPECFTNEQGIEVDMWAYGVVLYELKHDETPFYAATLSETQNNIKDIKYERCTGVLGDLVDRLLRYKAERIDVQQCKEHPFFAGVNFDEYAGGLKPSFVPEVSTEGETVHLEGEEIEHTCEFVGFSYDPCFDGFEVRMKDKMVTGMIKGSSEKIDSKGLDGRLGEGTGLRDCTNVDQGLKDQKINDGKDTSARGADQDTRIGQVSTTYYAYTGSDQSAVVKMLKCSECGKNEVLTGKESYNSDDCVNMSKSAGDETSAVHKNDLKALNGAVLDSMSEHARRNEGSSTHMVACSDLLTCDALTKRCDELISENNVLKEKTGVINTMLSTLKNIDLSVYNEKIKNMTEKFRALDAFKEGYRALASANKELIRYREEYEDLQLRNGVLTEMVKRGELERISMHSVGCEHHSDVNSVQGEEGRNDINERFVKDRHTRGTEQKNGALSDSTSNSKVRGYSATGTCAVGVRSFSTGCKEGVEVNLIDSGCKRKVENERVHRTRDEQEDKKYSLEAKLPRCTRFKDSVLIKTERMIELESEVERLLRNNNELKGRIAQMDGDKMCYERKVAGMKEKMLDFNYYINTMINNIRITLHDIDIVSLYNRMNKEIRTMKKLLKVREQEKKEIELMNTTEVTIRKKLEKEILRHKAEIKRLRARGEIDITFKIRINGEKTLLRIEKNQLYLLDIVENLSNSVSANLSKSEKLRYKRKNVVKLVFIEESTSSAVHTRSRSQLLEELRKEKRLYASIERLSAMHTGRMLERTKTQLEGSLRKIKYLEAEIENADESGTQEEGTSREGVVFYDGHVFVHEKGLSGYCNFCDEPHYSISLACEQCGITVHRQCYMLAMSCDMCKSVKKGRSFMVEMRNFEEAERLVKILKKDV